MRLTQTLQLETGGKVTVKEITPAIWNKLCKALGEDILTLDIKKFLAMEPDEVSNLTYDLVELEDGVEFNDLGYSAILEIWGAFRTVSASFLSLLFLSLEKELPQNKEPVANPDE